MEITLNCCAHQCGLVVCSMLVKSINNDRHCQTHLQERKYVAKWDFVNAEAEVLSATKQNRQNRLEIEFLVNSKRSTYFDWLLEEKKLLLTFYIALHLVYREPLMMLNNDDQ